MKNKIMKYIILIFSLIFLITSLYSLFNKIKANKLSENRIEINNRPTYGNGYTNKEKINNFIDSYNVIEGIDDKIFSGKIDISLLGLNYCEKVNSVIETDIGNIIRINELSTLKFKWGNIINSGTIRFLIMNTDGSIVYENKDKNISIQDEVELDAGNYFIFVEIESNDTLKYNLVCSNK